MSRPTARGGSRKGAGRKSHRDPTSAAEAVEMLRPFVGDGCIGSGKPEIVVLDLDAATALLWKLWRRKPAQ